MKKLLFIFSAILIAGSGSILRAQTQGQDEATGLVHARLITPISITDEEDLEFGVLIPCNTAGTAYITVSGGGVTITNQNHYQMNPSLTGCVTRSDQGGIQEGPATFRVVGEQDFSYGISLPPITESIPIYLQEFDNPSGIYTLELTGLHHNIEGQNASSDGVLNSGTDPYFEYFAVGGTLAIPANAPWGSYSGQFEVEVYYN
jgi:hypothetical protein